MARSQDSLIAQLGDEISDPDEETFLLYSQDIPSQNLGFIDPKASTITVTVGTQDHTIIQSPGILSSSRAGGTTGAVVWKLNVLLANFLPTTPLIPPSASILELGCGISPLNALALRHKVSSHLLTDQGYVQKLLRRNIDENPPPWSRGVTGFMEFMPLDWETDDAFGTLRRRSPEGFDVVLASDCVYNYALVKPFVQACREACRLRLARVELEEEEAGREEGGRETPTLCVVAQQLRNDEVFCEWLSEFARWFRVWRVPDGMLPQGLRPGDGYVIHVGVLRGEDDHAPH